MELSLPVARQIGEDGVVGDGVAEPAVQPLGQRVTGLREQQLRETGATVTIGTASHWP